MLLCFVFVILALASGTECMRLESLAQKKRRSDCWKARPVSSSFFQVSSGKKKKTPGFGMDEDKIEPFVTVTKDGFFEVACLKDAMVSSADKHGDGKFEFANQNARVSIVWYDRIVPKEDRSPMTPQVCFDFCRTVPDAGFFGLAYGRQCYCSPYFKREAGDSSQCDAVCEGDKSQMCGGMTKQSMYAMHLCADTENDLASAKEAAEEELKVCKEASSDKALELATMLEEVGNDLKERAGKEGDSVISIYGQTAVVYSGDVERGHEAAKGLHDELSNQVKKLGTFAGADFTNADTITEAEDAISEVKKLMEKADEVCGKTAQIIEDAKPVRSDAENHPDGDGLEAPSDKDEREALKSQYYPITYWVEDDEDTEGKNGLHRAVPSSCKGTAIDNPIIGQNLVQCAVACDALTTARDNKCIGFQHYRKESGKGMCTLLSYIDEISYYTEGLCSEGGSGFLQTGKQAGASKLRPDRKGDDQGVRCVAKFHDMKGFAHRLNSKRAGVDRVKVNVHKRCF